MSKHGKHSYKLSPEEQRREDERKREEEERKAALKRRIAINYVRASAAFDFKKLRQTCMMREKDFHLHAEAQRIRKRERLFYRDKGSNILAVAHLDSVANGNFCTFTPEPKPGMVLSPSLDDRLGAYTIIHLLPKLGIETDLLLTTGEETGDSTAEDFETEKPYDWMFSFDRTGTDVVMYQFETIEYKWLLKDAGWSLSQGSFSDISFLGDLGCAGFNFGVGYEDYHGNRSHVYLEDYFYNIARFMVFHEDHCDEFLEAPPGSRYPAYGKYAHFGNGSYLPASAYGAPQSFDKGFTTSYDDSAFDKAHTYSGSIEEDEYEVWLDSLTDEEFAAHMEQRDDARRAVGLHDMTDEEIAAL